MHIDHTDRSVLFGTPIIKEQIHKYIESQGIVSRKNIYEIFGDILTDTINGSLSALQRENRIVLNNGSFTSNGKIIIEPFKRMDRASKLLQTFTASQLAQTAEVPFEVAADRLKQMLSLGQVVCIGNSSRKPIYRYIATKEVRPFYDRSLERKSFKTRKSDRSNLLIRKFIQEHNNCTLTDVLIEFKRYSERTIKKKLTKLKATGAISINADGIIKLTNKGEEQLGLKKEVLWNKIKDKKHFTYRDLLDEELTLSYVRYSIQMWVRMGYINRVATYPEGEYELIKDSDLSPKNRFTTVERQFVK